MPDRRQRDKDQTIRDILRAARRLFSRKGLHGTSLRDIEEVSKVSKGLILHHFESKDNLYAVVQDQLLQEYTAWLAEQRASSADSLEAQITTAIRGSLSYLRQHDDFRRITLWSYLEGRDRITELGRRFTTSLVESMRVGQQTGLVREDIDVFFLPFLVRGAIDYWIRSEALREEMVAGGDIERAVSDEDLVETLVKLLIK
jgi:AcrR family transcriptional regulator